MLQAHALACERDGRRLFRALDFSLDPGELLQITGVNGSGKTTLLKILMGLYTDYEGDVRWESDRHPIYLPLYPPLYLGHKPGVSNGLTVLENLAWLCALQGLNKTASELDEALSSLGLVDHRDSLCANLSEGQRKRVNLARYILCDNACWIMDEPFSAIDAPGRAFLEEKMQQQVSGGGAIILASHQPLAVTNNFKEVSL